MINSLEQETEEEFETKYNLIFENPVGSNNDEEKPLNQILESDSGDIKHDSDDISDENQLEDDNEEKEQLEEDDQERAKECTALVTVKERRLMAAQNMFKKSIKISLKSFLISLSLSFLNLFI